MATSQGAQSLGSLAARLDEVTIADRRRLQRRLDGSRRSSGSGSGGGRRRPETLDELAAAVTRAEARLDRRRAAVPEIRYPEELPVSQRRDELAAAIGDHQVVIVAGETGSGKTTQLPKICLGLGRGVRGLIGHTQPRRLAARTVAERIADELGTPLGEAVGYAVRFTDHVGERTLVKLMTDGILLTDIHRDRDLLAYDTIIVDEAHERSLNIDFILGYLRQLLPRRPDLKVIVTSATIDPERFSAHFGDAPIVEVSGRTWPVEVRYRPVEPSRGGEPRRGGGVGRDQLQAIAEAVTELRAEPAGDILVFLSGEREIRDTAHALRDLDLAHTEILPLYARLSAAEQHKVFASHPGRRIVLATNVAETSLTVPGIRYVVDPGTARISRYSHRLKVQRLPIEAVSQASASQRAGRCGRVAPGVCIRLYDEDDFESRPTFTEPEILRTNLASVILQMTALGLGDVAAFPFIDPPDRRAVADGVRLLEELGAIMIGEEGAPLRLTPVGGQLARLPVDPRFGRMVLEGDRQGCLREVLVIAAGLSIEDPRERPAEMQAQADQLHARFADPSSDFLAFLELWRYTREEQRARSSNQFRKLCRAEFLNHLRIREWQDVHSQLRQIAGELGMKQGSEPAAPDVVHHALLSGLLSHIGMRDTDGAGRPPAGAGRPPAGAGRSDSREFRGPRNSRFAIFPGSALARKPPAWVMAAELVETSRLWARTVARIQPQWVEELAPHLVQRAYSDPHWSAKRATAMAFETVTLYGLVIVARRLVPYAPIDPDHARELFIRHALVEGDWVSHHAVLLANRELLAEVAELEHRYRRRDLQVDDDTLAELYAERVDPGVTSGRRFDSWWKKTRRTQPDLLAFTVDDLLSEAAGELDDEGFPTEWQQGELVLPLSYTYEPGDPADGVTVHIPLAFLNQVRPDGFDWQVPGLREELVATLLRTLPKAQRRHLVPVPDYARAVLDRIAPGEPLVDALARELPRLSGEPVARGDFAPERVPVHLAVNFRVEDGDGAVLGEGRDLGALQARLAPRVRRAIAREARGVEQAGLSSWSFGELPRRHDRGTVVGYPALVDEGESVAIRVFESEDEQHEALWAGVRRLVQLAVPAPAGAVRRRLADRARLALTANPYPSTAALADDLVMAAFDALLVEHGAPVWDAVAFDELVATVRHDLDGRLTALADSAADVLVATAALDRRLAEVVPPLVSPTYDDVAGQRVSLVYPGFVAAAGADRLADVERYLRAAAHRLAAVGKGPARDRERMAEVHRVEAAYGAAIDAVGTGGPADPELERIGWLIEELRVSLFAQQLGTPGAVSVKRVLRAIEDVRRQFRR